MVSKRKKLAIDIVGEELLLCGGEWIPRKELYAQLLAEGYARKYVEFYMVGLAEHQPKEEEHLKSLQVTASTGTPITLCPKCKEVREEIAAIFSVPLYPQITQENATDTMQPEMVDVPFRPICYCQCEREGATQEVQLSPMPGLAIGRMVHYVCGMGRHEAAVVIEIFDAVSGHVKLRNLYNLCLNACTYSEAPVPDSWHWIEKA